MKIRVTLDGELLVLPARSTVADLLRQLELSPEILSVVRNGKVVRRSRYKTGVLEDGDDLTAVLQVGGG